MKKNFPDALKSFLQSHNEYQKADLFAIALTNGQSITATTWQQDVLNAGTPSTNFYASKLGVWSRGPITSEAMMGNLTAQEMKLKVTVPNIETTYTNLLLFSNQFENAVWNNGNITVTPNATTDPFGGTAAEKIAATATVGTATTILNQSVLKAGSKNGMVYSIYVKQGSSPTVGNNFVLRNGTTATNLISCSINYSTGVVTGSANASSINVGNGWWRLIIKATTGISFADTILCYVGWTGNTATLGDFIYAYGAQLEQGTFVGPYVNSGSAAATTNVPSQVMFPGTNVPLMQTVSTGLFDKATVYVYTAYSPLNSISPTPNPNGFDTTLGLETKFIGEITNVDSLDRTQCTFTVTDPLYRLNLATPPNIIQSPCRFTLFDSHCALNKASFTVAAQVAAGSTNLVINTTAALGSVGTDTLPYALGVIKFTSGQNNGLAGKVKTQNSTTQLTLDAPFIFPIAVGDQFTITPGCDLTQATCTNKFSNLQHFGGFPFTPAPETVL